MIKCHKIILISIFLAIFIIPSSYAIGNETNDLIELDDARATISIIDANVLAANNDYYFNSSLDNDDGDGSIQNPYKHLVADRIKGNCNIYLADGEYNLDDSKTIVRVNILGSNPQ